MMETCSRHSDFQNRQFMDETGNPITGQKVRFEDCAHRLQGDEGFDETSARLVIYNFRDGYIHSDFDEPAIQYAGHYEVWDAGSIQKVVSDGGDTEEYWENGKPVRIEKNLAERRELEAG